MNERQRVPWSRSQHEYARLLQYRNRPGDRTKASADRAGATSLVCGMTQLLDWDRALGPVEAEGDASGLDVRLEHRNIASGADAASVAVPIVATHRRSRCSRHRDGDVWQVDYGPGDAQLKDARGVHPFAVLHAASRAEIRRSSRPRQRWTGLRATRDGIADAGRPLLDQAARTAYRRRLDDLARAARGKRYFQRLPVRAERARV